MSEKLFKNLATFNFESLCVLNEIFKNTVELPWEGRNVPEGLSSCQSFSWNDFPSASFILIISLRRSSEFARSKTLVKEAFFDIETTINLKMSFILENLNQRHNPCEHMIKLQIELKDCGKKNLCLFLIGTKRKIQ